MSDDAAAQKEIDDAERAIEQWKVKKLIQTLEAARGSAHTMTHTGKSRARGK